MDSNCPMGARIIAILVVASFFTILKWGGCLVELLLRKYKPSWIGKAAKLLLSKEAYEMYHEAIEKGPEKDHKSQEA